MAEAFAQRHKTGFAVLDGLIMTRTALNERFADFARRTPDVDSGGRVFLRYILPFGLVTLVLRAFYVFSAGVPDWSGDPNASSILLLGVALLALSLVMQRCKLMEATLVLRAGTFACVAAPFSTSMCLFVFHTNRHLAFADDRLAALDHALGFDWIAYARWFDIHPLAWRASVFFYDSVMIQFPLAILCLALTRSAHRLYVYLCAQIVALMIVALIAGVLPAIGAYEQAGAAHMTFLHTDFLTADRMTTSIRWLRSDMFGPGGINYYTLISFPSYHAVCAALFVFAFWRIPYIRWAGLVLNLGMAAATPLQGSHYLVDVLAGLFIAVGCLFVCSRGVSVASRAAGAAGSFGKELVPGTVRVDPIGSCRSPRSIEV